MENIKEIKETKQASRKLLWRTQIVENNIDIERNVADLAAYLMTHRFERTPADEYTFKTANKWVRRIQKNTHFSHADEETTRVILDWYAERNATLRRMAR